MEVSTIRPVVVVPTYNNAQTLVGVLDRITRYELPVIIINDGSTDSTARILADWKSSSPRAAGVHVLTNDFNRGKAAALRRGFARAGELGFTHAITIDSDGQLDPEEIPFFLKEINSAPHALVLGYRDQTRPDYPGKSKLGRGLSNLAIRFECGRRIYDSQCGFRAYPIYLIRDIRCRAGRFGYETEMITRAAWAHVDIRQIPVTCRYFQGQKRVTHFRIVRDTVRHICLHIFLVVRAALPLPHRAVHKSHTAADNDADPDARFPALSKLFRTISDRSQRRIVAISLAMGVFISNLPNWGSHLLVAVYLSRVFGLNTAAAAIGSFFSTPPVGPLLIAVDIIVGHFVLSGGLLRLADLDTKHISMGSLAWRTCCEWVIGSIIVSAILALLTYASVMLWFKYRHFSLKSGKAGAA
jgi:uncharacterized protein (DUF2062 family)